MNRPSRTDDDFEHPTWNQNPPFLAPDLTTCQDLNGIVNAREQRNQGSGATNSFGFPNDEKSADPRSFEANTPRLPIAACAMSGRPLIAAPATALGGEGRARRSPRSIQPPSGWIGWIASVVVMSTVFHVVGNVVPAFFSGRVQAVSNESAVLQPTVVKAEPALERLSKRQNACANSVASKHEYNVPLHVGGLLIILAVSSLACAIPMIAKRFPFVRIPEPFFFAVRHFGTGILLATAFVHLLPTAFINLGDPCLGDFWTSDYPAMPGAIALVGIFFVAVIEMVFSPARHFTPRAAKSGAAAPSGTENGDGSDFPPLTNTFSGGHCNHRQVVAAITRPARVSIEPATPLPNQSANVSKETLGEESQSTGMTAEQIHKKSILQCMMLEVGILFHSIFIGMALSVAVGGGFTVLLIAIAFHQTFEGLALGARISSISWPKDTRQPWLMVLAYGCTTPIGQAIGLATHTLYAPDSEFGLILVGTMNALSSGLLVFAALIELLAEDFLSDHSWSVLRGKRRVMACLLVFFGAVCMSLVGAWA
ncbi:zinc-regulated transporter 2 [Cladorrhinum samala]|uniref:Zinc-regulated transporter 2 n=1 Tax=Cladorrhinum samala TaxID=585594 RepID=A0AAV9HKV7_9PEZI|nr:zinc-regulated transporter 2 [Cladorrhinum samala]